MSLAELDIVRKRNLVMSDCQGWRKHALDVRESAAFVFCIFIYEFIFVFIFIVIDISDCQG